MNIFVWILIGFAILGLMDKIRNNKHGLGTCFEKGLFSMGSYCFTLLGFYCVLSALSQLSIWDTLKMPSWISVIVGSLLAPDLGGYPLITTFTGQESLVFFAGVFLTSTLGCTLSFQFPIFTSQLSNEEMPNFMQGILDGIFALIPIFLLFCFIIPVSALLPLILLYLLLLGGMRYHKQKTISILCHFARLIQILGYIFLILCLLCAFYGLPWISFSLLEEGIFLVFQIAMIVAGSNVLCELLLRHAKKRMEKTLERFSISFTTFMGLFLSLGSSLAMVPLYPKMDEEGKRMNAAFSVCGAYALGGQMGFIAAMTDTKTTLFFILLKLAGGILALLFVRFQCKHRSRKVTLSRIR